MNRHFFSSALSAEFAVSRRRKVAPALWVGAVVLGLTAAVWVGKEIERQRRPADAIFVLGGHENREREAAKLAAQHPDLPVWVSSGSPEGYVKRIFQKSGVSLERLHLNYQAKDTVSNFTTLADRFRAQGIRSVYLVTSQSHMNRAYWVGEIVFGSRDIALKPVTVAAGAAECPSKSIRDVLRALVWLGGGKTP